MEGKVKMKTKLLSMLLAVSMVGAMMAGCGSKTENTDTNANTNTATEAATELETEIGTDAVTEATTEASVENTEEVVTGAENTENVENVAIATGIYAGSYTKEAMGSEIVYEYTLTLNEDNTYAYHVAFEMGGTEYPEDETGTYAVEDTTVILTPATPLKEADTAITVTSTEAGKINFLRCVSSFASEQVMLEAILAQ